MKLDFFSPQIEQFDTSINLFSLVLNTRIFVCSTLHCFYMVYSAAFLGFLVSFLISLNSLKTFSETNSS